MEVCIDSLESALNAEAGGACRVELCSSLPEGGTTPSLGLLEAIKDKVKIPVMVMIRPRAGDFLYTEDEFDVMKRDIKHLKETKADGFVFGILKQDGTVDKERCKQLIDISKPKLTTFHRAFDMTKNWDESLEDIIHLGFDRLLTSGHSADVAGGLTEISNLVEKASGRITIMPGGGINKENLHEILQKSGAREFHCSARQMKDSLMQFKNITVSMGTASSEYAVKVVNPQLVKELINIATDVWASETAS